METLKTNAGKEVKDVKAPKLLPITNTGKPTEEKENTTLKAKIDKLASFNPFTAEERIERSTHFEEVKKRYTHLKEKANDLKMFEAGNDKLHAKVYLENQAGFKFEVRNSNVIEKVLGTMKAELNVLLEEAKNEVLTFEI